MPAEAPDAYSRLSDFLLLIVLLILISEEAEGTEVAAHGTSGGWNRSEKLGVG